MKNKTVAILAAFAVAVATSASASEGSKPCDRNCLKNLVDTYIDAMVAHDPGKAPLARNITIVENIKRIRPGEGLWKTASAPPTTFRIYVPDPVAQQVGFIGVMQSEGKPIQIGLRLQVENGLITEAEHVIVHNLRESSLKNLQTPRAAFSATVPEPYRDSRGRLLKIAADYYDALDENNGRLAPFADDCVRFENGMQTSRNPVPADAPFGITGSLGCAAQLDTGIFQYIDRIDNRRVWIADEETGLAFGLSHFRHSMEKKEFRVFGVPGQEVRKMDFAPFDLPAVHVFKIWGGQIHEIEALGFTTSYNSPTGWE